MRLHRLNKFFGEKQIFCDLSLELPEAGIVGIYGPSGCGKTTLLFALCGLLKLDSGEVKDYPARASVVFQEDRLLMWLSALENVCIGASVDETCAKACLDIVCLSKEDYCLYPKQMSGGMRRRVAIARALAYSAPLLLLDEPFSGIDEKNRQSIIKELKKRKNTQLIYIISHDWNELNGICDEIIEVEGPPLSIVNRKKIIG